MERSSHCFQWSCLSDITSRYLSEVVADLVIIINYFRSMLMIANIMFSNHVNAKNRFYVCCQSLHTIDTQSYDSIPIFHWVILLSAIYVGNFYIKRMFVIEGTALTRLLSSAQPSLVASTFLSATEPCVIVKGLVSSS